MASAREGLIVVGPDRRIVFSNRMIEDFCGGPAAAPRVGEMLDAAAERIVAGEVFAFRTARQRREMLIALRMPGAADLEARLVDGRWVRLTGGASENGGAVYVVSDVTAMKEREIALCEAVERAETANRSKSDFLATMSHELRTPLNAVIGFSEIIAGEALGPVGAPQYAEFAGEVVSNGRGLLKIINDILMLVKSERGDLAIESDRIELGELLEECAAAAQAAFKEAGVTLEAGPTIGACVAMGDRGRLRQAVMNLLSNAAKFTPAGGRARLAAFCAADRQVAITVSDTGIGMREDDVATALAPFGQVDSSRSRRYTGTGLGLTLARAIVEAHCGELRIDTAPGEGTTVAIFLPAAEAEGMSRISLAS